MTEFETLQTPLVPKQITELQAASSSKQLTELEQERLRLDRKKNFYTKSEKQLMVSEQLEKLRTVFKQLDPNTYNIVKPLIESVAFMSVELKDLEGVINENGQIETYRNGAYQTGYKKSAASEAYNSMKKTYLADIKLLADLVGASAKDFNDELMDFIRKK